ncbi:NADH dehydrogenase [ubiquinone] 1 beta subcomplex subunit 10-like [Homarus americanus]|uniref:NADH dehydrogenase [ubiquinone] 1 beta subcomplex subunit 10-like n=1 Tax=Homarus americanus TaxID=6706 RepID=UPI001C483E2F|nr:NADH dehydrogenase [ubiquinone] 1 beta subcomplex subunit 10-like [Homarus americanus]
MGGGGDDSHNTFISFIQAVSNTLDAPVTWFRESVVTKNRPQYPWYHRQFRRVPTIDECYTDDVVCFIEANEQFKRDRMVDNEVLNILRQRQEDCILYEATDHKEKCAGLMEVYDKAAENWFIKYGDLGVYGTVVDAYMKQKHRMIWERRHGPVGSGMKDSLA